MWVSAVLSTVCYTVRSTRHCGNLTPALPALALARRLKRAAPAGRVPFRRTGGFGSRAEDQIRNAGTAAGSPVAWLTYRSPIP